MAKRMLADVLWTAANKCLCAGDRGRFDEYDESCLAAKMAYTVCTGADWESGQFAPPIPFLAELGCDWDSGMFHDFRYGEERQGVRYMWLLLAMHVAEDEGIEVGE